MPQEDASYSVLLYEKEMFYIIYNFWTYTSESKNVNLRN